MILVSLLMLFAACRTFLSNMAALTLFTAWGRFGDVCLLL